MAALRDIVEVALESLQSVFGQFPIPLLRPDTRLPDEEGGLWEIEIPVGLGKKTFAVMVRKTALILRLALSEEAVAAGFLEKTSTWLDAARHTILEKFPKIEKDTEKNIKITLVKIDFRGDVMHLKSVIISARR